VRGVPIRHAAGKLSCGNKSAPLSPEGGRIKLRILADRGSLEVFANDGRVAISHGVLLDTSQPVFEAGSGPSPRVSAYPLKSVW